MPLLDIPANTPGLKRSHEDYVAGDNDMTQSKLSFTAAVHNPNLSTDITPCRIPATMTISGDSSPISPLTDRTHSPTPPRPTIAIPTDPKTTPTPAKVTAPAPTGGEPPAKRKCLTVAEKEEKSKAKLEKEQAKVAKQAEKAKAEEEKKAKAEEREKEREKKRLEKEQKQQEKERKQQEKEEEQRKAQEAKDKKERSQLKLASFFKAGPSTPSKATTKAQPKADASPSTATPVQSISQDVPVDEASEYRKVFQPFFVKEYVKLAKKAFDFDEAALLTKSRQLDEYVGGSKDYQPKQFKGPDSVEYFCLPTLPPPRGRPYPSVRKIVSILSDASTMAGASSAAPIDLTDSPAQAARRLLSEVPMKYLRFFQDVRPAYYGTVTSLPPSLGSYDKSSTATLHAARLRKLARKPISRQVLPLQYDYDSEAEWVDDGDGEDIEGDDDDDDDDEDDDEDMTDFLDNSEDLIKRPVFASGMEPESSGLCFEDARAGPSSDMAKYRMEFILDNERQSIDPFSSQYWQTEPCQKTTAPTTALLHPSTAKTPSNAFAALSGPGGKKAAIVPANLLDDFKHAILKYPKLSKVGLVEVLSTQFEKCTKAQVKNSVEMLAERHDKTWRLKAEHAL
ncbi:hypothetical protein MCOR02_010845 [Pyricularia oryzae]|nr:hypothetical protein MCOR02_010845 [Pyricularia oryzae]KAI6323431.1 hypothetical protein MCOR34_001885 [Pyricularia oryzae]KAI6472048.1 hypothetical protein MCOR17_002990 [Pyricularia oryzae]KAI6502775.1 hypothetical protein MCOR13_005282 [Pyricularia oryzae]KAI6594304.1 hypothetical protein MCOR04_003276 [Pyricularia oryzae]